MTQLAPVSDTPAADAAIRRRLTSLRLAEATCRQAASPSAASEDRNVLIRKPHVMEVRMWRLPSAASEDRNGIRTGGSGSCVEWRSPSAAGKDRNNALGAAIQG